jgi:hypothetical protein
MSNTVIKIKRTSVTGRAANTTTLTNPGELGLNMTDRIMYSTNGSVVFEIGANNTNVNVSNTLTVKTISANGSNGTAGQVLTSNGTAVYWNTGSGSGSSVVVNEQFTANGTANSFTVTGGYTPSAIEVYVGGVKQLPITDVDISSGTTVNFVTPPLVNQIVDVFGFLSSVEASGVTSVATGNGLTGGPITTTGTISVLANTGLIANSTGLHVNSSYATTGKAIAMAIVFG